MSICGETVDDAVINVTISSQGELHSELDEHQEGDGELVIRVQVTCSQQPARRHSYL